MESKQWLWAKNLMGFHLFVLLVDIFFNLAIMATFWSNCPHKLLWEITRCVIIIKIPIGFFGAIMSPFIARGKLLSDFVEGKRTLGLDL